MLNTSGHEHLLWVRLTGCTFTPRWLAGSIPSRRVSPVALTTRNPRELWAGVFELQLAITLVSASHGNANLAWLSDPDPATEPAMAELLELALEELEAPRLAAAPEPISVDTPPTPQRGWLRAEVDAMRKLDQFTEKIGPPPGH